MCSENVVDADVDALLLFCEAGGEGREDLGFDGESPLGVRGLPAPVRRF
jgi:hypothetical protein